MWFDNEIEAPAIYAYFNDPWTDEDYEVMGLNPNASIDDDDSALKEMRRLKQSSVMYEGGGSFDDQ
jgi:hypothetical protein